MNSFSQYIGKYCTNPIEKVKYMAFAMEWFYDFFNFFFLNLGKQTYAWNLLLMFLVFNEREKMKFRESPCQWGSQLISATNTMIKQFFIRANLKFEWTYLRKVYFEQQLDFLELKVEHKA